MHRVIDVQEIRLTVESAVLENDDGDTFGKQDPFCIITVPPKKMQTSVKDGAGTKPVWNESFHFKLTEIYKVFFVIMDKDDASDSDFIGQAILDLNNVNPAEDKSLDLPLKDKSGKSVGKMTYKINFGESYMRESFNMKLTILEGYFSKAENTYFDTADVYPKVLFGETYFADVEEDALQKSNRAKKKNIWFTGRTLGTSEDSIVAVDRRTRWNKVHNFDINVEDVLVFKIFDKDVLSDDDIIGTAEQDVSLIRQKKMFAKELSLRSKNNQLLGSQKIKIEALIEPESPVNLKKSLNSSDGNLQNSSYLNQSGTRGNSKERHANNSRLYKSPEKKQRNLQESSEIELDYQINDLDTNIERQKGQNSKLQEHYERLDSKLNETTAKMLNKKRAKYQPSDNEQQKMDEINKKTKHLQQLQKKSTTLRNELVSETAYERMNELKNLLFSKDEEIKEVLKETGVVKKVSERQKSYFEEAMVEKGFTDKMNQQEDEITKHKTAIKDALANQNAQIQKQQIVNNAIVVLEKRYREIAIKHKYDDKLKVVLSKQPDTNKQEVTVNEDKIDKLNVNREVKQSTKDAKSLTKSKKTKKWAWELKKEEDAKKKKKISPIMQGLEKDAKKKEKDDVVEKLEGLTFSDESYKVLQDEWKNISEKLHNMENSKSHMHNNGMKLDDKLKEKKDELKEKESYCKIQDQKIKELQRTKIRQEKAAKQKRAEFEAQLGEEEWDSKFDTRSGTRMLSEKDLPYSVVSREKTKVDVEKDAENESQFTEEKKAEVQSQVKGDEESQELGLEKTDKKEESMSQVAHDKEKEENVDVKVKDKKSKDLVESKVPKFDAHEYNANPDRTEIIVGQRYGKKFETLWDDQSCLLGSTPHSVIKITANCSESHIAGMQFHYMTVPGDIVEGRFYGDRKVNLNRLTVKEQEIGLNENIVKITCCFSKGIHWIEFETSQNRTLQIGNKKRDYNKSVEQSFEVKPNESVRWVSGGLAIKSNTFTYLAFHVDTYKEGEIKEDIPESNKISKELLESVKDASVVNEYIEP